jgi:hypothetical protein
MPPSQLRLIHLEPIDNPAQRFPKQLTHAPVKLGIVLHTIIEFRHREKHGEATGIKGLTHL